MHYGVLISQRAIEARDREQYNEHKGNIVQIVTNFKNYSLNKMTCFDFQPDSLNNMISTILVSKRSFIRYK